MNSWRLWLYLFLFLSLTWAVIWAAVEMDPRKDGRGGSTVWRRLEAASVRPHTIGADVATRPVKGLRPGAPGAKGQPATRWRPSSPSPLMVI
jgi:hypothetical protein